MLLHNANKNVGKALSGAVLFVVGVVMCLGLVAPACAKEPVYRIGYLEEGPYWAFAKIETSVLKNIRFLTHGTYDVQFPADAHLSPGWDKSSDELKKAALSLLERDDLDMIIGMGTTAAQMLVAHNKRNVPIVCMGLSDPKASGLLPSQLPVGKDNVVVRVVRDRWKGNFVLFYDIIRFESIGLLFPDTDAGKLYSNFSDAVEVGREKGFKVRTYTEIDSSESYASCREGIRALLDQGIEAFYISGLNCFDPETPEYADLLELLHRNGVYTFARDGSKHVRAGAMMGVSTLDYTPIGEYFASMIEQIIRGGTPKEEEMYVDYRPSIALNLGTAREMGFDFPYALMISADEIFIAQDRIQ